MIQSFADKDTEKLFNGKRIKQFEAFRKQAERKLFMLDNALELKDLQSPPGNKLEALKGNRKGQHSIRINDQWRICFEWQENGPGNVEIVDYH